MTIFSVGKKTVNTVMEFIAKNMEKKTPSEAGGGRERGEKRRDFLSKKQ